MRTRSYETARVVLCLAIAALAAGPALANSGSLGAGSSSVAVIGQVGANWNGAGTLCSSTVAGQPTFTITQLSGPCDWQQANYVFTVTGDGTLDTPYCWAIETSCVGGVYKTQCRFESLASPAFCEANLVDCTDTDLSFGQIDIHTFTTNLNSSGIPTLGTWGAIGAGAGLLVLGAGFIVRRARV